LSSRRCHWTARKTLAYTSITAVLALLTWTVVPAPTYTYVVRELSQTMTGVFTFGAGLRVSAGNINLDSGQKVYLEGPNGNSYMTWDETRQEMLVYGNGHLSARVNSHGVIPGDCPSDVYAMEDGTQCFDTQGRTVAMTSTGPVIVTGSAP